MLCGLGGEEWVHVGRWQGLDWRRLDLGRLMMSRAGFVVAEGRLGYENCVLIPGDLRSVLFQLEIVIVAGTGTGTGTLGFARTSTRTRPWSSLSNHNTTLSSIRSIASSSSLSLSLFRSSLNKQGTSVVYWTIYGICLLVVPYTLYLT